MRAHAVCSLAALAMILQIAPAYAQTEAAKAQALKRYQEGVALHDRGKEEEAYLQFVEAYAVVQTPPILFNLARTEQLTGRHVAAAEHFRAYLAIPEHPRVTPALRAKAQGYLTELQPLLGHIVVEAPAGAALTVDGKAASGSNVEVEPGPHTVAAKVGDRSTFVNVTVVAGATVPAHIELAATPVVVAPVPAVTPPSVTPVTPPPIEPPPPTQPASWWTTRREVGVAVAGVGVVGLVLGGVFGGERGGDTSSASTAQSTVGPNPSACFHSTSASCGSLSNALQSNGSAAGVETGFLVGGIAVLAAGLLTTFWPTGGDAHASALVPSIGPHGGSFSWTGSF